MEQEKFHLKDHILEFEGVLKPEVCASLVRFCNHKDSEGAFDDASVIGNNSQNIVRTNIRNTKNFAMTNLNDSFTDQHWCNVLIHVFQEAMKVYKQKHPLMTVNNIYDIQLLKYVEGGHYVTHVDDHPDISRTLSFIYRLNNDYEGGDLTWSMHQKEFHRSKTKANSMLVWPSSFLYPHCVEPITKGTRWSIVAWAR